MSDWLSGLDDLSAVAGRTRVCQTAGGGGADLGEGLMVQTQS